MATLIDQEAPDSAIKVKKLKKLKVSDTTEEHVFPLEAPASPGTEEQERKVNDTLTSEDNIERAEENYAADIDRSVPELVEFQVSNLEKKRKKEKRLKIRRGGNLEPGDELVNARGISGEVSHFCTVSLLSLFIHILNR